MKTSVREGKWRINSLYFHVIRSVKLCVTDLKDVTDDRQLVKIPWQSWDKGALRSARRCFVRSYGPLVTRVADRQDISDRPSSPLTSSVGQLHDWHSRYPGNYLQHVSREQEWKPAGFRGFCYKKKKKKSAVIQQTVVTATQKTSPWLY